MTETGVGNENLNNVDSVTINSLHAIDYDENSYYECVVATQLNVVVPETQIIVEYEIDKVQDFLEKSWANMAETAYGVDDSVDLIQKRDFQTVISKRRNKKLKAKNHSRSKASHSKSCL